MQTIDLISNDLCPFTQRAAIQLAEKGVPFTRTYIDLADKPDWFRRISPLGKVPVLRIGETVVFESAVICEYLEETAPGQPLHPADPLQRARHRGWIEFASAVVADVFGFYMAPDVSAFDRKSDDLRGRFRWLEDGLGPGPYFAGCDFHLVDAAFAPVFRLFDGFDRIGDFGLLDGMPAIAAYRAALAARDSVQQAVVPDYQARFLRYLATRDSYLAGLAAPVAVT